jgi:hypothetical protein
MAVPVRPRPPRQATAGERMLVGLAEKLRGAARLAGQPEVGPVDVVVQGGV